MTDVVPRYDPDQPRDENGRWTDAGGGGGGSSTGGGAGGHGGGGAKPSSSSSESHKPAGEVHQHTDKLGQPYISISDPNRTQIENLLNVTEFADVRALATPSELTAWSGWFETHARFADENGINVEECAQLIIYRNEYDDNKIVLDWSINPFDIRPTEFPSTQGLFDTTYNGLPKPEGAKQMPLPTPNEGETQSEFMGRCMHVAANEFETNEQAVAVCLSQWRDGNKAAENWTCGPSRDLPINDTHSWDGAAAAARMLDAAGIGGENPNAGQAARGFLVHDSANPNLRGAYKLPFADIIDGRLTAIGDGLRNAASRLPQTNGLSSETEASARAVLDHYMGKIHAAKFHQRTTSLAPPGDDPLEYVMSDTSIDRMGDVIEADGWYLDNFKRNPIALFNHNSNFVLGEWRNVRIVDGQLRGHLKMLPPVSDRLKEIHAAIKAGVLRAVSVGFRAIEAQPLQGSKTGGVHFLKSELVECSLVAVPANANALAVARSLQLSPGAQRVIFGSRFSPAEPGSEHQPSTLTIGKSATQGKPQIDTTTRQVRREPTTTPPPSGLATMTLSEKIQQSEARLNTLRDQLNDHLAKADDNLDEEAMTVAEELNQRVAAETRQLEMLKASEQTLALRSEPLVPNTSVPGGSRARPFAVPRKEIAPKDYIYRGLAVAMLSHITKRSPIDVLKERYGDDEPTKVIVDNVIYQRAATVPATTTLATWAAELVQTSVGDFVDSLMPQSIYPGLSARGGRFTFGRNGTVTLPSRAATPTVAGAFVGQGSAIPVRRAGFTSISLTPKKMGVISTFTREIAEHSTPAIEGLLRTAMQEDTAVAIDSVLLDANVATAIRPAGLLAGVVASTTSTNSGFTGLVDDIKTLVGVLTAANALRNPVWIMDPAQALAASLAQNNGGEFPFQSEINAGRLMGYPVLQSTTATAQQVILLDAADFVSATGDEPRFDVSDQAVLHEEDSSPQAIGLAGSATLPIRSLWQTDTIALRMILDINWSMRRTGLVAFLNTVLW